KRQSEARCLGKSRSAASVHSSSMVLWGAASVPNGRELRDHHAAPEHAQHAFQNTLCFEARPIRPAPMLGYRNVAPAGQRLAPEALLQQIGQGMSNFGGLIGIYRFDP